jgi:hypothetical protein
MKESKTIERAEDTGSCGAARGSAYSPESAKATLEEVYQWLHDGPMDDWDKRCHYHRKIGDMLGKKRVEYGE